MTPEEARTFGGYSVGNAAEVMRARPCGCEPYADVFTYRRWQALGFQVQRGEKAIRLGVIVNKEAEDGEEARRVFTSAAVFCRHQVAPIAAA